MKTVIENLNKVLNKMQLISDELNKVHGLINASTERLNNLQKNNALDPGNELEEIKIKIQQVEEKINIATNLQTKVLAQEHNLKKFE